MTAAGGLLAFRGLLASIARNSTAPVIIAETMRRMTVIGTVMTASPFVAARSTLIVRIGCGRSSVISISAARTAVGIFVVRISPASSVGASRRLHFDIGFVYIVAFRDVSSCKDEKEEKKDRARDSHESLAFQTAANLMHRGSWFADGRSLSRHFASRRRSRRLGHQCGVIALAFRNAHPTGIDIKQ
jgi:hypothetical protein